MTDLFLFLLTALVPFPVDLATIPPPTAAKLANQVVELRLVLGPRIGVFGNHVGHDHASADGTSRTVWTPAGVKVGRVLLARSI